MSKRAGRKWVKGVEPSTPFAEAARAVLAPRLEAVAELLPLACGHANDDVEHVHRLRVATRRAGAALAAFGAGIRRSEAEKARRRLRRIRRAAGKARECDVMADAFRARLATAEGAERAAFEHLLTQLIHRRAEAQAELEAIGRRYRPAKLARRNGRLLDAIRARGPKGARTFAGAARLAIPRVQRKLSLAAANDLSDLTHLHELRILGKRLRYELEIFAPCLEAGLRDDIYARVEAMQERLGSINDRYDMTLTLDSELAELGSAEGEAAAGLRALLAVERAELERERAAFVAWWHSADAGSLFTDIDTAIGADPVEPVRSEESEALGPQLDAALADAGSRLLTLEEGATNGRAHDAANGSGRASDVPPGGPARATGSAGGRGKGGRS
ncbi:MAG: CHAD domain-containing protein [Phycisphaerales bacterium]|nr:CHAD domain-containing protein [Phycisphaerales bacterium]